MTDETVHIQPAIPSRASQQNSPAAVNNAFLNQPSPGTAHAEREEKLRKRRVKARAKKASTLSAGQRLRAAEIRKINAKRKKNMKKAAAPIVKKRKAKRKVGKHPALAAPYKASRAAKGDPYVAMASRTKNPNRPLEMKNQMSAVLSMVGTLQKSELGFFSQAVPAMQALSRSGRRRVIAALQQVYG